MSGSNTLDFSMLFSLLLNQNINYMSRITPAIFFLTNKNGEIIVTHEDEAPVSMTTLLITVESDMKKGDYQTHHPSYLMETTEVAIPYNEVIWEGRLGMMTESEKYNSLEINAFIYGLKQALPFVIPSINHGPTTSNELRRNLVNIKVTEVLKTTQFSYDFHYFLQQFLSTIKENLVVEGEVAYFRYDENHKIYVPEVATNDGLIHQIKKYKMDSTLFFSNFNERKNKALPVLRKTDAQGDDEVFLQLSQYCEVIFLPVSLETELGLVVYFSPNRYCTDVEVEGIVEFTLTLSPWMRRLIDYEEMIREKTRKDLLLKVNRKFYSSMDVNAILEEIIGSLREAYPSIRVDLLLSHDWNVDPHLPIKPLNFANEGDLASLTYITGEPHIDKDPLEEITILYVPLKGKQGVYGVFQIEYSSIKGFTKNDIEFIQVLADTGGNAIENAELYQQSQQHITDLQLINKTSHKLNELLNLSEMIPFMVDRMQNTFHASEVGFIRYTESMDKGYEILEGSSRYFRMSIMEGELDSVIDKIKSEKEEVFILNASPLFSSKFQSIMAVPMIHNKKLIGCVIALGIDVYAFSFDAFKLFKSLVYHSTLAMVNSMLHEELRQLVNTDYLTKLKTREYMDECIAKSLNQDSGGAFILLDIDRFKQVNDHYGHQTGDAVLIQVAQVIEETINNKQAIAARWGGEELAIYISETSLEEAVGIAKRINKVVKEKTVPRVSVSCGVSYWDYRDIEQKSLKQLFHEADEAMYRSKNLGRDRVSY